MKHYSAMKKKEIMPFAAMWIDLEGIMLSKIVRQILYDITYMYNLIVDNLRDTVNENDYENVNDYYEALNDQEEDFKECALCNNDFDIYGEDGRKILAKMTGIINGRTYETLAQVLEDENAALDVIWISTFNEAVSDLCHDFEVR